MIAPLLFRRQFFTHSVIPPTRSSNFHGTIRCGVSSILQPANFLSILWSLPKDGATSDPPFAILNIFRSQPVLLTIIAKIINKEYFFNQVFRTSIQHTKTKQNYKWEKSVPHVWQGPWLRQNINIKFDYLRKTIYMMRKFHLFQCTFFSKSQSN